jgi:hypothetical protein
MKNINFATASLLMGRDGVTLLNEKHEVITSWVQFFTAQRYYTNESTVLVFNKSENQEGGKQWA